MYVCLNQSPEKKVFHPPLNAPAERNSHDSSVRKAFLILWMWNEKMWPWMFLFRNLEKPELGRLNCLFWYKVNNKEVNETTSVFQMR